MDKTGYSTISQLAETARHTRLLNELEKGDSEIMDRTISYKLKDSNDQTLTFWSGTIQGPPETNFEGRVYELKIQCGQQYPLKPPVIKFANKINLPCVNPATGRVEPSKFGPLNNWKNATNIETILYQLKNDMKKNARLPQPKQESYY